MKHSDQEIIELFFEVDKRSRYFPRSKFRDPHVFSGQSLCLATLENFGSMSQQELADLLHIRSTSVRETVKKLEDKGLVQKVPSTKDRRRRIISLTKEGQQYMLSFKHKRSEFHSEMLVSLTETEKEHLFAILHKILQHYDELEANERG